MMGIASCGSDKQEELTKMIPASAVTLKGEYKDLFKISEDSVKIILLKNGEKDNDWEVRTVIPLSNTKSWSDVQSIRIYDESYAAKTRCINEVSTYESQYVDANGCEIDKKLASSDLTSLLKSEDITTEKVTIKYESEYSSDTYKITKELFDKISGLSLNIYIYTKGYDDQVSYSGNNDASSNEWDTLLDEYENYVDKYVSFYKKAMSGDMSAMTEYVSLLEKAEKLSSQLETSQNDMSSAQLKRYLKITEKMTNAILDN